jgi:hypothetical protein
MGEEKVNTWIDRRGENQHVDTNGRRESQHVGTKGVTAIL